MIMTHNEALETCKREVALRNFTVSCGCWSENGRAFAFSVETYGPATYGHPRCAIRASADNKGNWTFYSENTPIQRTALRKAKGA
jgi:hypothetical protein